MPCSPSLTAVAAAESLPRLALRVSTTSVLVLEMTAEAVATAVFAPARLSEMVWALPWAAAMESLALLRLLPSPVPTPTSADFAPSTSPETACALVEATPAALEAASASSWAEEAAAEAESRALLRAAASSEEILPSLTSWLSCI